MDNYKTHAMYLYGKTDFTYSMWIHISRKVTNEMGTIHGNKLKIAETQVGLKKQTKVNPLYQVAANNNKTSATWSASKL